MSGEIGMKLSATETDSRIHGRDVLMPCVVETEHDPGNTFRGLENREQILLLLRVVNLTVDQREALFYSRFHELRFLQH